MYTVVEARGLPSIQEGREFIIHGDMPLRPPTDNNELFRISLDGVEPRRVLPVSEGLAFSCPVNGAGFERTLLGHTIQWMFTAFCCPYHPEDAAYLDIFPKLDVDYGHDWHNAFEGLLTPDRSAGGIIMNTVDPDEYIKTLRSIATARAVLTPKGLRKKHFTSFYMKTVQKIDSVRDDLRQSRA